MTSPSSSRVTRKYTLDEILAYTVDEGPRVILDLGVRLSLEEAECLSSKLKENNLLVEAYDFPRTQYVWESVNDEAIPYRHHAMKQLLEVLARKEGIDYTTFEGFKHLLPFLTVHTFRKQPINRWQTTLGGMLQTYNSSPALALQDIVDNDEDFTEIRRVPFHSYDVHKAPMNMWKDKAGNPTKTCLQATKQMIVALATPGNVDYRTVENFKQILQYLTANTFRNFPINIWGTTLNSVMKLYDNSPSAPVLYLIDVDADFASIKKVGLEPYDFPNAPMNTWVDESGSSTGTARKAIKQLIVSLASAKDLNYKTVQGFRNLLPDFTEVSFTSFPIDVWGTTLGGLFRTYKGSPSGAIMDVIKYDDDFVEIRNQGLEARDFPIAPQNTWMDKNGEPTDAARNATKQLIAILADVRGVDYTTIEGLRQLELELTANTFRTRQINVWGTTLSRVLKAYDNSPRAALLDLIKHDGIVKLSLWVAE